MFRIKWIIEILQNVAVTVKSYTCIVKNMFFIFYKRLNICKLFPNENCFDLLYRKHISAFLSLLILNIVLIEEENFNSNFAFSFKIRTILSYYWINYILFIAFFWFIKYRTSSWIAKELCPCWSRIVDVLVWVTLGM